MNFNEHITYCKLLDIKACDDEYLSEKFKILDIIFRSKLTKGTYYIKDSYLSHSINDNNEININKSVLYSLISIDIHFFDISETILNYYFKEQFNMEFIIFIT